MFPFVEETGVFDYNFLHKEVAIPGKVPVFCIKEKGSNEWLNCSIVGYAKGFANPDRYVF